MYMTKNSNEKHGSRLQVRRVNCKSQPKHQKTAPDALHMYPSMLEFALLCSGGGSAHLLAAGHQFKYYWRY